MLPQTMRCEQSAVALHDPPVGLRVLTWQLIVPLSDVGYQREKQSPGKSKDKQTGI